MSEAGTTQKWRSVRPMSAIEGNPDIYRTCAEGPRLAPNRLAPAFRRGPLLRVERKSLALIQNDAFDPYAENEIMQIAPVLGG